MRYHIDHETLLEFETPIHEHHCEMRVTPLDGLYQRLLSHSIETDPPANLHTYQDAFGNHVTHFSVIAPHQKLVTRVRAEVETLLDNPFDYLPLAPQDEIAWYEDHFKRHPETLQFVLHESVWTPAFQSLPLKGLTPPPARDLKQPVQSSLLAAMNWVYKTLAYKPASTQVETPAAEALKARAGVCQDFAHVMISLVRSWKLPARYVMGYMKGSLQRVDDSQDEEATHAWVEVLIPGTGWRGFDPTNDLCANHLYIPVAVGRDYRDAAPQRGTFKGSAVQQTPKVRLMLQEQAVPVVATAQQQQQIAQ